LIKIVDLGFTKALSLAAVAYLASSGAYAQSIPTKSNPHNAHVASVGNGWACDSELKLEMDEYE